jgi:hypothetical protein
MQNRSDDKTIPKSIKWACITIHKWLPSAAVQIAGARAWGAHEDWLGEMDVSTTYVDDVSKLPRTTRYDDKLPKRRELLAALHRGAAAPDQVYFREPMCVGFAAGHAKATVEAFWARGALVYVQTMDLLLRAGDDIAGLLAEVEREAKAKRQADWRQRQPKMKRKT